MDHVNTVRLRAIIAALTEGKLENPLLRTRLLSFLQHKKPIIVMQAIDGFSWQGETDTSVADQVLALKNHPSRYVRGSVARFGKALEPDKALPLLKAFLEDPDAFVREDAAEGLGYLHEPEAIPYLRPLLTDADPDVREAAQFSIETLEQDKQD
jgi:HEAT repeat protein